MMKLYRMAMGGLWLKLDGSGWYPARRIAINSPDDAFVTPKGLVLKTSNEILDIEEYKWKL